MGIQKPSRLRQGRFLWLNVFKHEN
jgi:hypothetical protein